MEPPGTDQSYQSAAAHRRARRIKAATRKIRVGEDDGSFDRAFWGQFEPAGRLAMMFELFLEGCRWQGIDGRKLRLQRSVVSVKRRAR